MTEPVGTIRPATWQPSNVAPTSTCWSSAPASPASTSCTARAKRASPRSCSRPAAAWAAPGTGTATPARGSTPRATPTRYLFSKELFDEWEWQEHFAEQPETERYLNHVVDRFDLRRHIRFGAPVTSAVYDEASGTWTVAVGDGTEIRARFLVAATGVLSVPYFPDVPGRDDFRGESHHTGLWPATPVDFAGKRVAVIGTGSSGVQVIPAIADEVASLTVYQRTANWCTPLNNAPITAEEQAQLRADFEAIRETLNTSLQRVPPPRARSRHVRRLGGGAAGVLREDVEQPRLLEAHQQLHRPAVRSRRRTRSGASSSPRRSAASSTIPRPRRS